jgi:tetratricopeptide (TPR) repeat protein
MSREPPRATHLKHPPGSGVRPHVGAGSRWARCRASARAVLVAAITFGGTTGCGDRTATRDAKSEPTVASTEPKPAEATTDETRAERYAAIRAEYDADPGKFAAQSGTPELARMTAELRAITNEANDVHLKANAALLLGALHQERGQWADAAAAYRRATVLVPDDAGPWMALARAEAKESGRLTEAITAQERALELDPDNLENFLALGELLVRADRKDDATAIYAKYEVRRKGLIDGLTLTKDGNYIVSIDERIACAEALAAASDLGTAVALMYALEKDPEPRVRVAVVNVMGLQRLVGYKDFLAKTLAKEKDEGVKAAIVAAIAEIERDPVELPRGPAPVGADGGAPAPSEPAKTTPGTEATPASTDSAPGGTKPPAR